MTGESEASNYEIRRTRRREKKGEKGTKVMRRKKRNVSVDKEDHDGRKNKR